MMKIKQIYIFNVYANMDRQMYKGMPLQWIERKHVNNEEENTTIQ